ncbi:decarboxylating NADP(+)-dependent phosphogluconate dehydrogenase [Phocaeicola paurosaccharolyticus]|jgi:6-phosphogluconate dehydrogenase|uniref:decarboxylating NADP(+)-dependent phosphogluconate dehydrogenase n=1 Tax=Phocaeicola paurosaccharolyticus TaxID=732242 RepID=UPI000467F4F4|nr:decarboxylating NADP(+)-dependent phosphogluconate dehydrogenase [Phocaeicola paurosaccharolyticus]
MEKLDIALLGLGVMGQNLALNMDRNGWKVGVWNRHTFEPFDRLAEFITNKAKGTGILGFGELDSLMSQLKTPRVIFLMVKAGDPVDEIIDNLLPLLEKGDIIIDGGNSYFKDTERRVRDLAEHNISFVGCGVSGGEEGALNGASIMPGGDYKAWPVIKPILKSIAAKAEDGTPCCDWVGPGGAGHYVKMVHNGIEYGDMQLIAEVYYAIKHLLDYDNGQIAEIFQEWNSGRLKSYLLEITTKILRHKDYSGHYVLDLILDTSGQKGTGKWSATNALEMDTPLDIITSAVFARNLASNKELRSVMHNHYNLNEHTPVYDGKDLISILESSLYAARLVGYAQGFSLMHVASEEHRWNLDYSSIALIWRAGCIIRSSFLNEIASVYKESPFIQNLLLDDDFNRAIKSALPQWKKGVSYMLKEGFPVPVMSASLNYFLGLVTKNSNANMIQAMRDYFGAHSFERVDCPRGEFFHENWLDTENDS